MSTSVTKLLAVMLLGILGMGFFLPIVEAKVLWVNAYGDMRKHYCPDVCQTTKRSGPDVPYAVPAGIHEEATKVRNEEQMFYVCAAEHGGWHIGYNVKFNRNKCYITTHKKRGYALGYYSCLCSDTPVEPIKKK